MIDREPIMHASGLVYDQGEVKWLCSIPMQVGRISVSSILPFRLKDETLLTYIDDNCHGDAVMIRFDGRNEDAKPIRTVHSLDIRPQSSVDSVRPVGMGHVPVIRDKVDDYIRLDVAEVNGVVQRINQLYILRELNDREYDKLSRAPKARVDELPRWFEICRGMIEHAKQRQ